MRSCWYSTEALALSCIFPRYSKSNNGLVVINVIENGTLLEKIIYKYLLFCHCKYNTIFETLDVEEYRDFHIHVRANSSCEFMHDLYMLKSKTSASVRRISANTAVQFELRATPSHVFKGNISVTNCMPLSSLLKTVTRNRAQLSTPTFFTYSLDTVLIQSDVLFLAYISRGSDSDIVLTLWSLSCKKYHFWPFVAAKNGETQLFLLPDITQQEAQLLLGRPTVRCYF